MSKPPSLSPSFDDAAPLQLAELAPRLRAAMAHRHIALGVSGGGDSMALMLICANLFGASERGELEEGGAAFSARPNVTVLTVDHGLREEAVQEAAWVKSIAGQMGFAHETLLWQGEKPESDLQNAARAARYRLMADYCARHQITALLTAHHLDDQAETLLMRLARGSGVDGLSGMAEVESEIGALAQEVKGAENGDIQLLRPLLAFPKSRLLATLKAHEVSWIEDPSNEDLAYERVRIRRAGQTLAELGIAAEQIGRSARRLRRARQALERQRDEFIAAHSFYHQSGFAHLDHRALLAAPEEIALRALARVVQRVGGAGRAPRLAKCEDLLEALLCSSDKSLSLGGCKIIAAGEKPGRAREGGAGEKRIYILRELRRSDIDISELAPGQSAIWDRRFRVSLSAACPQPVTLRALGRAAYDHYCARFKAQTVGSELGLEPVFAEMPAQILAEIATSMVSLWCGEQLIGVPHLNYRDLSGGDFEGMEGEAGANLWNVEPVTAL